MKNLRFWVVLLLALPALLAGCRNQDPTTGMTTVSGQVVDSASHKGLPNATVQVYLAGRGGGHSPTGVNCPADAQGRFSFHFDATSTMGYALFATAPPGYFTPDYAAPELTAGRSNTGLVVPMLAPAWVRLQLVDEPPKSRVVIDAWGYEGPGDTFYYPRDTILIRPVLGGFTGKIMWAINETGVFVPHSQDVKLGALDTVTVRISF